jgi:hypothetical protein
MPDKNIKKVENFNNNKYLLDQNNSNNIIKLKKNDCSFNYNNVLLTLGLIILIFFLWMKYSY